MERHVGDWLIIGSAVIATLAVLVRASVAWWRSVTGIMLMALVADIATVLDLAAVRITLGIGDAPWFALLRLAVFAFVPVVLTFYLALELKAQGWFKRGGHS